MAGPALLLARFTVPGKVAPFARLNERQRAILAYQAFHECVGRFASLAMNGAAPWEGPLAARFVVVLAQPSARRWDLTNVWKAAEDGMSRICYLDDKQVVSAELHIATGAADLCDIELRSCPQLDTWRAVLPARRGEGEFGVRHTP